jgi:hypothetical protein
VALNCTGCEHKENAVSSGYCEEFHTMPQIDECQMHTKFTQAPNHKKSITDDRPGYIWLSRQREEELNASKVLK